MAHLRPYRVTPATCQSIELARKSCLRNTRLAIAVPADGHIQQFAGHIFSAGLMHDRCCRCDKAVSTVLSEEAACGTTQPSDAQLAEIRAVKDEFMAAITGTAKPAPSPAPAQDEPQAC